MYLVSVIVLAECNPFLDLRQALLRPCTFLPEIELVDDLASLSLAISIPLREDDGLDIEQLAGKRVKTY
jgi:hypothetical protein